MNRRYFFLTGLIVMIGAWEVIGFLASSDLMLPILRSIFREEDLSMLIPDTSLNWGGVVVYTEQHDHFLFFVLRKSIHLFFYGCITLYAWYFIHHYTKMTNNRLKLLAVCGIIIVIAAIDEIFQSFIPYRSTSIMDILLDFIGFGLSLTALWIVRGCKLW